MDTFSGPTIYCDFYIRISKNKNILKFYCPDCNEYAAYWHKENLTIVRDDSSWNKIHPSCSFGGLSGFFLPMMGPSHETIYAAIINRLKSLGFRERTLIQRIDKYCNNFKIKYDK
jgi:hypothetical protein